MAVISFILSYFLLLTIIQITLSDVFVYNDLNKLLEQFDDEQANFGPSFPSEGLKGYVITTNPPNGCKKISPPPNIPTHGYHWIALIPRIKQGETCEFALKVQNAQNANFSAVIIYNYEDKLFPMGSPEKVVHIPSTLITYTDGLTLISHYLYNKTLVNSTPIYYVKIGSEQSFNFGIYAIPFVLIIGISFLSLVGFLLIRCYLQRRRTRRHRLPSSALKQLKIKKFVKGDPWEVCAICLDDYVDGAKLRILPCDHAYHMKCIDPWLLNSRRQCPVCKRYVFPNDDNSDEEENNDHQQPRTMTEQTPLINSNDNNSVIDILGNRPLLSERQLINTSDSSEDLSSSLRSTTISNITTTQLVFNRPSTNSRRYGSLHDSSTQRGTTNISAHSVVDVVSDIETTDDDDERMHSILIGSEENPAYVHDEESTTNTIRT